MNSNKISAVINTYNAERYLPQVLDALKDFDEIVVCDMESTDNTLSISQSYGCHIVTFPKGNISICEPARNFAIQAATHEWVLVVDADEVVTPQLRDYLYEYISRSDAADALRLPRRNMFLGRYIHSSPDYQTRFFRKNKVDWPPIIHCRPIVDGITEDVPASDTALWLLHLDDAPLSDRYAKLNTYSNNEVPKRLTKNYGVASLLFRPLWFFIRCYFIQGGWRDGRRGILRALSSSVYQIMLLSKLMEHKLGKQK